MAHSQPRVAAIAIIVVVVMSGGRAAAQQSTLAALPEDPPAVSLYRLGSVLVNPTLTVPEVGQDSNVFNDDTAPRQDFVVKFTPRVDFFSDFGLFRLAAEAGTTFTYYHRFESERSIAEQVRGRLTARLSRVRPWIGAASVRSNERTVEIDSRAKRSDRELAAGVQFDVSPLAVLMVSANRLNVAYSDDDAYLGTSLGEELNRTTDAVSASLRFQATPLTTLTFTGYVGRDTFEFADSRDAKSRGGEVAVNFGSEAVIRGRLAVGFRDHAPVDPTLAGFRGMTGRGGVTTVLPWRAILGADYVRDVQYSYDEAEGYYVENGADVVYTQRIGGPFDVQVKVGRHALDYSARLASPARSEALRSYQGGIGYSVESGSRVGINYEFADRVGEPTVDRPFSRRRLFGSFTYEFWK